MNRALVAFSVYLAAMSVVLALAGLEWFSLLHAGQAALTLAVLALDCWDYTGRSFRDLLNNRA